MERDNKQKVISILQIITNICSRFNWMDWAHLLTLEILPNFCTLLWSSLVRFIWNFVIDERICIVDAVVTLNNITIIITEALTLIGFLRMDTFIKDEKESIRIWKGCPKIKTDHTRIKFTCISNCIVPKLPLASLIFISIYN